MKINKIATILIIVLTLFLAFSILYIINNVDHNCVGDNCPICEQIIKCEENIEGLGFSVLELILKIAICTTFIYGFLLLFKKIECKNTLISLKVEMLN